jgi:hypothetical protein
MTVFVGDKKIRRRTRTYFRAGRFHLSEYDTNILSSRRHELSYEVRRQFRRDHHGELAAGGGTTICSRRRADVLSRVHVHPAERGQSDDINIRRSRS